MDILRSFFCKVMLERAATGNYSQPVRFHRIVDDANTPPILSVQQCFNRYLWVGKESNIEYFIDAIYSLRIF